MTFNEFIEKYGLKNWETMDIFMLFNSLDKLYLEFTKEQVIELAQAYYDNADDIYNSIHATVEESLEKLKKLFDDENGK